MRFVCDQDVDVAVRGRLTSLGHDAWTAAEAGQSRASDDDLAVYAHRHNAALVTHDVEFSQRRRKHCIGWHIQLRCNEWDAADLMAKHIEDVVALLERHPDLFIALSHAGMVIEFPSAHRG